MQLVEFSKENIEKYSKQVTIARHMLEDTGLFTDEALAKLLDAHPNHLIDFQHIPDHPDYPEQQVTVDFTGADGEQMLKAAKSEGKVWINIREAMNRHPEYNKALNKIHSEMEKYTGKNSDRRNSRGGILISSPTAGTPYHADPTITHLWHIRGHKKMWVYPRTEEFLPEDSYESIILGEINEDMPFSYDLDKGAIHSPVDLHGGELVTWPHRSPHRVENVSYCVSMAMEFSTRESAFVNAAVFTNGLMRRRLGMNPSYNKASLPEKLAKVAMGRALQKMGAAKSHKRSDMVLFKFDPTAAGYVSPVETPYQRVH